MALTELSENLRGIAERLNTGPIESHIAQDYLDVFAIAEYGWRNVAIDTDPVFDELFIRVGGDKVVKRWDWSPADVRTRIGGMA